MPGAEKKNDGDMDDGGETDGGDIEDMLEEGDGEGGGEKDDGDSDCEDDGDGDGDMDKDGTEELLEGDTEETALLGVSDEANIWDGGNMDRADLGGAGDGAE